MCIVCAIKADLSKSQATAEQAQGVLSKVETLAHALGDVIDVAEAAHKRNPDAFTPDELAKVAKAEELFEVAGDGLLLAALLGGVKVETVHVELQDGESVEDAVTRTMAAREAASPDATKH